MKRAWRTTAKIKHLFAVSEDPDAIRQSMSAIADVLDTYPVFAGFGLKKKFRSIPDGDEIMTACDYANRLLDRLYDYADEKRIWIG